MYSVTPCAGVRPYKCNLCEKSFTQRCSLESHCLKVHGVAHQYDYKQRRSKVSTPLTFHSLVRSKHRVKYGVRSQAADPLPPFATCSEDR